MSPEGMRSSQDNPLPRSLLQGEQVGPSLQVTSVVTGCLFPSRVSATGPR